MEELEKRLLEKINDNVVDLDLVMDIFKHIIDNEFKAYTVDVWFSQIDSPGTCFYADLQHHGIMINPDMHKEENVILCYFELLNTFFHELMHVYQNILLIKTGFDKYTLKGRTLEFEKFCERLDKLKLDYNSKTKLISYYISERTMNNKAIQYKLFHDCFSTEHEAVIVGNLRSYKFIEKSIIVDYELEYGTVILKTLIQEYKKIANSVLAPMDFIKFFGEDRKIYNLLINRNISNYDRLKLGLPIDSKLYARIKRDSNIDSVIDFDSYCKKIIK